MSVAGAGISGVEVGFALGALAMTVLAGLALYPLVRKALREERDGKGSGSEP